MVSKRLAISVIVLLSLISLAGVVATLIQLNNSKVMVEIINNQNTEIIELKKLIAVDSEDGQGSLVKGDTPTDTTNPLEISPVSSAKECTNTTLKLKISVPNSWNCEDTGDLGGGQSYLNLTKGNFKITIGTAAIGFNCSGIEASGCDVNNFYKDSNTDIKVSTLKSSGATVNIGGITYLGVGGSQQILVRHLDGSVADDIDRTIREDIDFMLPKLSNL